MNGRGKQRNTHEDGSRRHACVGVCLIVGTDFAYLSNCRDVFDLSQSLLRVLLIRNVTDRDGDADDSTRFVARGLTADYKVLG